MRISVALLFVAIVSFSSFPASAATGQQYVYVGNAGNTSISVFAVNRDGTLKTLGRVISPLCGTPTYLSTAGRVLLAAGDYTPTCNSGELGGALIYLYPILSSGKLGAVSQAYENDVEDAVLDETGRLAFTSAASFNPHAFQISINGWNVSKENLRTSLPGSPYTFFFNSQTGDGYLPYAVRVATHGDFLYGIFSGYSGYNETQAGLLGVMTLLHDGGIGTFVAKPVVGCKGSGVTGVNGPLLVQAKLESGTATYQPCLSGTKNAVGASIIDSSTGVVTKTHNAFEPPSGMSVVPIAVDPSGRWLIASNGNGKIDVLAINQTKGSLSEPPHHIFSVGANSVAFDHTGNFLYAAQTSKNRVAVYSFNPKTGGIIVPAIGTQLSGPSPTVIVVAQP